MDSLPTRPKQYLHAARSSSFLDSAPQLRKASPIKLFSDPGLVLQPVWAALQQLDQAYLSPREVMFSCQRCGPSIKRATRGEAFELDEVARRLEIVTGDGTAARYSLIRHGESTLCHQTPIRNRQRKKPRESEAMKRMDCATETTSTGINPAVKLLSWGMLCSIYA